MEFFIGISVMIAVFSGGVSLHEYVKRMGQAGSGKDAKQILEELKALRAEMAEIRASGRGTGGAAGPDIVSRLDRLQEEMTALRDTSTQFDMSFDAALDRLESRMERVEERTNSAAAANSATRTAEAQVLSRK